MGRLLHALAVLSLLGLALLGQVPAELAGWGVSSQLPRFVRDGRVRLKTGVRGRRAEHAARLCEYLTGTWRPAWMRSLLLCGLWVHSGGRGPAWVCLAPWVVWLWHGVGVGWPAFGQGRVWAWVMRGLWQGQRLLLLGYLGLAISLPCSEQSYGCVLAGCVVPATTGEGSPHAEPQVAVVREPDGSYQVTLQGQFRLRVSGDHPFRLRLLVLFLSLLDVPGCGRGSRRTREGRMPFVRQVQLAEWFGVPQPCISRWLRYWLAGDWANLLSLASPQVLTAELVERIVTVFASFPTWSPERVYQYLRQQGVPVTQAQVTQAAQQSGWRHLRQTLLQRYHLDGPVVRLRDEWLVEQLLAQVRDLLGRLEDGRGLPPEARCSAQDLLAVAGEAGVVVPAPVSALPWLQRMEQVLFGQWERVTDGQVRCPYCGSDQISRKSAQPRLKKYYDETGQVQRAPVYRYYCRNPHCEKGSFTHLPPGLLPYSPYRTELHALALQMYAWGYSTYRRTGTALGVASLTVWRWVSAWGHDLLPVAALFGMVRSSGVVGVDEKYVLVPKNDKPLGEMRRWMYVYLAVDVWTYDLLHIAVYPHNNADSAEAFLQALRAKGYHPQVIVTDLRQDYGPSIARIFPQALHHLCVFHALQNVQKQIKHVYGPHYAELHPEAQHLKQQIYAIFAAATLVEAAQRYATVLAMRPHYLQLRPEASAVFDFLERHWPKLANCIGVDAIPATNNTVELVIRRFDQHYQNFCGFESLPDTHAYLAVFEKLYRFTPFSQDAQPRIRGKSPLQLAGYDLSKLPMATLCAGQSIIWPIHPHEPPHVPSS